MGHFQLKTIKMRQISQLKNEVSLFFNTITSNGQISEEQISMMQTKISSALSKIEDLQKYLAKNDPQDVLLSDIKSIINKQ